MKILLAVDGSKCSLDAVDNVIEHADWYRERPAVELLTVHLPVPKLPRMGQFCIDHHLAAALRGDVDHGLFFRGSEPVPFGSEIRSVSELTEHLLDGHAH